MRFVEPPCARPTVCISAPCGPGRHSGGSSIRTNLANRTANVRLWPTAAAPGTNPSFSLQGSSMRNCVAVEEVFALAALYPVRIIGDREERNKEYVEVRSATAFSICGRYAATWAVKLSVLPNWLKARGPSENNHLSPLAGGPVPIIAQSKTAATVVRSQCGKPSWPATGDGQTRMGTWLTLFLSRRHRPAQSGTIRSIPA